MSSKISRRMRPGRFPTRNAVFGWCTATSSRISSAARSRFDYETEMLIMASRKGCRIASVPITTIYSDEVSSIHPVRDTIRFFQLIRRYEKGEQA